MSNAVENVTESGASAAPGLTWKLVQAEPGSLVYAIRAARSGEQQPNGQSESVWRPGDLSDISKGGAHPTEEHSALHYAGYIGRVGVLAAALGVGAAVAGNPGLAWAQPEDSEAGSSASESRAESATPSTTRSGTTRRGGGRQTGSAQTPTDSDFGTSGRPRGTTRPTDGKAATSGRTPHLEPGPIAAPPQADRQAPVTPENAAPVDVSPIHERPGSAVAQTPSRPRNPQEPISRPTLRIPAPVPAPTVTPELMTPDVATGLPATTPAEAPSQATTHTPTGRPQTTPESPTTSPKQPARRAKSEVVDRVAGALAPLTTANTPAAQAAQTPVLWGVMAWVRHTFFNQSPKLAFDPTQTTQVDDTVVGKLNPLDPDGDPLAYSVTAPVNGGSVLIAPDGTFTYTPTAELAAAGGTDTFTVTATDVGNGVHLHGLTGLIHLLTFGIVGDAGHTATTTVTVDVNAAPVPAIPAYTLGSVEHTTGTVPGELHVTDADSDTLHYTVTGGPVDGAVTLAPDGSFTYTPTPTARHEASAEDAGPAELADTFTVTVDDTHGRSVAVPVTVAIDPTNSPPTITGLTFSDPDSDGSVHVSIAVTDPDTDPVTYLVVHDPAYGTVAPSVDGFTYTPTPEARHNAAATPGIDTDAFDITASDLHHGIDTATATVTISPANIAPSGLTQSVNIPDPVTGLVTGTVTGTDADGDALTYSGTASTSKGAVIVDPDGTFAYTPTATARHTAAADAATEADKSDTFTVTADDAHGGTADIAVTVAVAGANVAPVGNVTVGAPDQSGVVTGALNATDGDNDALNYAVTTAPGKGDVTVNPDGSFTYTPTPTARHTASADTAGEADKVDSFTVTVDDAHGAAVPMAVNVAVSPANTAPSGTVVPGSPDPDSGQVTGSTTFTDPDGDTLVFSGSTTTAKGSVTVNPDGTFAYTPTDTARHNAAADAAAPEDKLDSFTVTVNDGHGAVQAVPVTVAIGSANAAPAIDVVVPQPDPDTGVVSGAVNTTDPDGDMLSFSATTPGKGAVAVNPDGTFTYSPTDEARHAASADTATLEDKQDSFTVTVDDSHGAAVDVSVLVSVSPTNQAPTGTAIPGTPDPGTGVVTGSVSATDPEGDPLSYSGSTSTTKGFVTVDADGTFTYTPTDTARHNAAADTATTEDKQDSFTVTIDDAHGGQTPVEVTVAIASANAAPTIDTSVGLPDPDSGDVTGGVIASDPDGDNITYAVGTTPSKGTVIVSGDGAFSYTPTAEARHNAAADAATTEDKQDSFTVTVDDGHGSTSTVSVSVAISPANAAPTALPVMNTPDGAGNVGGSLGAADADSDSLVYTVTSLPASGTVTVNPDGTFTYDPTDAARLRAGFTQEAETDSFTVTITDGHGGTTVVPVAGVTVSPAQLAVTDTIPVTTPYRGVGLIGIAVSPDGTLAYTANSTNYYVPGIVSVIDTTTNTQLDTNPGTPGVIDSIGVGATPVVVAVSPDGNLAYVSNFSGNSVSVIDTATNTVIKTVAVGSFPWGVAVSPDGTHAYVANMGWSGDPGRTVSIIDTSTNTNVGEIIVGNSPYGIAISPATNLAYVTNAGSQTVSVIDVNPEGQYNTVIDTIPGVGNYPTGVAISPDGSRVYVAHAAANSLTVIDATTNTVLTSIPTGTGESVTISPDGSLVYVAQGGSVAVVDTATNTVIDTVTVPASARGVTAGPDAVYATGGSTVSVLTLVTGQNAAPVAADPAYVVTATNPTSGAVTGGVRVTDPDADTLSYAVTTTPAKGSATVNTGGTFTYTPTGAARHQAAADTATAGDKQDDFTVTVRDAHGSTVAVPVTVAVSPANTAPAGTIVPGSPDPSSGTVTGTAAFTDPDGDPLAFSGTTTTAKGSVTVNPDGSFTYTPTDTARHNAAADTAGTGDTQDSFAITVNDGHGSVQNVPVTVAIGSANAAPNVDPVVVPQPDPDTGQVNGALTATDPDGDTLSFLASTPGKGAVTVNADGTFTYTPTDAARHAASADAATLEDKQDSFTVTVDDAHGAAVPVAVLVSVSPTNQAPTGTVIPGAPDPTTGVVNGSFNASDPEADPLTFAGSTSTTKGSVTVNPDGSFTYTPTDTARHNAAADAATTEDKQDSFTVTIDDAHGGQTPVEVTVAIASANAAPSIDTSVGVPDAGTGEVTGGVTATDPDGDTITYALATTPAKGAVTVGSDGAFSYTPTDTARHDAATDAAGTDLTQDTFAIDVNDGHGSTSTVSVVVDISPTNTTPTAHPAFSDPGPTGLVGGSLVASDADGDTLTYTVTAPPAGGTVTVNPDGTFVYDPTDAARLRAGLTQEAETDAFTVTVSDGHGGTTVVPVSGVTVSPAQLGVSTVTVGSAPGPMVISGDDAYVANSGGNTVSVIDTTTDPDSVTVTIPSVSNPSGAAVNGDRLYVSNWSSSAVTVVDTTTNTVVQSIGSVYRPMGMDVSGGRLYVANYGNPPGSGTTVTVIDLGTNSVTQTINVGSRPYGVTANGNTVYVSNSGSNTISVIDAATNTVTQTVAVGARPLGMAINGDRLYVTNFYSNSVTVIDTATNTVIGAPISVGSQPNGIAFSPDGSLGYVSSYNDDTVTVFDTTTNTVIDSVRVGAAPATALASPDGNILVSNSGGNTVSVISLLPGQNTAPTQATPAYTVDNLYPVTGIVDGAVRATDVNADVLNYSVPATSTKGGAVTVNQAGVFTYTPTTTLRHNASADNAPVEDKLDSFTVTVTDVHGANVAVPVTVPISPANAAPTASPTSGTPDAVTGVVTGAVAGSDSDADALSYALNQAPTKGTVTVNADGTFTYDPTDAARLQAGQTPGPVTDSFTVTITDGHGGTTVAPVTGVTVSAAQLGITDTIPVGSDQRGIALTGDGSYAYVSNIGDQSISVIDTSTSTVVNTITGGFIYPTGVALSPDGSRLYTANWGYGYNQSPLTVIDTATNTVIGSIPAGRNSQAVAVSPDGSRVYVANYGSYGGSSVSVIDTATEALIVDVPMSGHAVGIGLNADGSRAYVGSTGTTVAVIDTATNTVTGTIPLSGTGGPITMSPDGSRAYVSGSNAVSVIDTATNTVIGTIPTGSQSNGTAFSADGTVLYVMNDASGTVSAVDVATNAVIDSATVGRSPVAVAVHPNGDAYVVNVGGSAVKVVSLVTGYNVAPTAQNPAYSITAVDPATGKVTGTVNATDANADVMSYVTSPTTGKGSTVTVSNTGAFEYTPTSTTRHAAAQEGAPASDTEETFTVKVVDAHGASTAVPVTVAISPTNAVPVTSGATVGTPDASGAVTGSLNVTDPDADTLVYSVTTAPTRGQVTVDPATGAYTYTPSNSSRVRAYSTPAVETDSFTVTASDGHGGSRDITVTAVPVSAADAVTTGAVSTGPAPYGVALSPNGTQAYVVNYGNNTVAVVDTATGAVTNTIGVGANPYGVALTPNGKYAYVTNRTGGTVSVIDTATKSVVKTVAVGNGPQGVAVSPDGNLTYVTNRGSGSVSVIDTNPVHGTYNTVIATVAVAGDPFEVAFSPDGTDAYVARAGAGSVAVIDTATSSVVNDIAVGSTPYDVTFSPDGTHAYVPNLNSNTVSVIDTASQSTTATISIPGQPTGVAVSPDGTLAYVTTMSGNAVSLVDTSTNTVIDTVPFNTGSQLYGVATSPDGTHAYVTGAGRLSTITLDAAPTAVATVGAPDSAGDITVTLAASDPAGQTISVTNTTPTLGKVSSVNNGDGTWTYTYSPTDANRLYAGMTQGTVTDPFTITVTDQFGVRTTVPINAVPVTPATAVVTATVPVGNAPFGVDVSPDGTRTYVTNANDGTVTVVDTATAGVIATIPVDRFPYAVAFSPDGHWAYVTNNGSRLVSVIDTSSNTVAAAIDVMNSPTGLAVSPDGSRVYVTSGSSLRVIDTATNTVINTSYAGTAPYGVAVSPNGNRAYVTDIAANRVWVIDTSSMSMVTYVQVGNNPTAVAVSPDGYLAYVVNQAGNSVSVINTADNSVVATIGVGSGPFAVAVSPDGSLAYVANQGGNSVTVIDTAHNSVIDTIPATPGVQPIPVGSNPRGIAVSPDGNQIYVTNIGGNTVSVISLARTGA